MKTGKTERRTREVRERYVVDREGRRSAVVIPIREYERLLEDIHDLAVIAERRGEPTVSFEELKSRLRADGFLPD